MNTVLSFVLGFLSHAHGAGKVIVDDIVAVVQDAESVRALEPGASCDLESITVEEFGNTYKLTIHVEREAA